MTERGQPSRERIFARLAAQIGELRDRLGGLPDPVEAAEIWRGIWYEEAHHSTAIEGNTLVLKQVEVLLAEGRAVGNRELRDYLEVRGYADAADWVYRQGISPELEPDALITLTEVRRVHEMALRPVWDVAPHRQGGEAEAPGSFRRHDIQRFPGGMQPPPWPQVPVELDSWVRDAAGLEPRSDRFPERVAQLHCRFEQIHPFLDGNGRTGRLVLNLLLVRLGYPPAIIYKRVREKYLRALRRGDRGDFGELAELLARAIIENLNRFVVPAIAGPARLVPLAALETDRATASALRVAAVRGRLQALKGPDGQWRSSRRWVDEYLGSRQRRGREGGQSG